MKNKGDNMPGENDNTIKAMKNITFEFDKKGFFVIFVDREKGIIKAEHYSNVNKGNIKVATGKLEHIIEGKKAEYISHTIARLNLVSRYDHAMYLGIELAKAEICLKNGLEYVQDEDVNYRVQLIDK